MLGLNVSKTYTEHIIRHLTFLGQRFLNGGGGVFVEGDHYISIWSLGYGPVHNCFYTG